jgi:hypothetical protein
MIPPDEPYGPDSFGGDDSESHYAAPALWKELRRTMQERTEEKTPSRREHDLKLAEDLFSAISTGVKSFELRRNDRDFQVGDELVLRSWNGTSYTGESCRVVVTYVIDGERFGALQPGFVCMSIRVLSVLVPGDSR